jgi:hypothetical protein
VEVDVERNTAGPGFTVSIRPVHLFPVFDPAQPGTIATWERREYDDLVTFDAAIKEPSR